MNKKLQFVMMKRFLLLAVLLLQCIVVKADTWSFIGQGEWTDPYWTSVRGALVKVVDVEESEQNPGVYRVSLWNDCQPIVYAKNPDKVYVSRYMHANGSGTVITVDQVCAQNGWASSNFGSFKGNEIVIPGEYFKYYQGSNASNASWCSSERKCILKLPSNKEDGMYMGLLSFNDWVNELPINLLDESTKNEYISFVDNMKMKTATLLYYGVERALNSLESARYPLNLKNAILITFSDGLDQGSAAADPEYKQTPITYADHLHERILNTKIGDCDLQAYIIGLKGQDVTDDVLFEYNMEALSSSKENIYLVNDIDELKESLIEIFEDLNKQISQRIITLTVPNLNHGYTYRFTLDGSENREDSELWFEGVYNIKTLSLEDVKYHGFTSTSGTTLQATESGVYLTFTLTDCRNSEDELLSVTASDIKQWFYTSFTGVWSPNSEKMTDDQVKVEDIKSSCVVMFALDASSSLGDLFPQVKTTANYFINLLAGEDVSGISEIAFDTDKEDDFNLQDSDVEIYNLQGVRVANPSAGIYICRKGGKAKKVIIR